MAIIYYSAPTAESVNIAGTALNGLTSGSASAILGDVDNGTEKRFGIRVWITLGSITPTTGGSITVRLVPKRGSTYADRTATIFTGEQQIIALTTTTGVKNPSPAVLMLDSPFTYGIDIVNNSGTTLAASGNEVYYQLFSEEG